MSDNDTTLQLYNDHVQDYVSGTPQKVDGDFKRWIDISLKLLPAQATILELGSGFGRDADYIESLGHRVMRTDGAEGFVKLLKSQGHKAQLLNALTDDFGNNLDMVFANAVLLHFTPEQVRDILSEVHKSLKPGGIFAFSLKSGKGDAWSQAKLNAPRFFHYWGVSELQELVSDVGFQIVKIFKDTNHDDKWVRVVAQKP